MLLVLSGGVFAYSGSVLKDYYLEVDDTEVIYLYPYLENYTAYFYYDVQYPMVNDSTKYSISLTNNVSEDVSFTIVLFDGIVELYNNSDYELDSSLTISNTSLFYFTNDFDSNKSAGEFGAYTICAWLKKAPASSNANLRFFSGYNVSGFYHLDYSPTEVVSSVVYSSVCGEFNATYDHNITAGDTEVFGFVCDSCNTTSILLGVDTDSPDRNKSFFSVDTNISNQINFSEDFMIFANEYETENNTPVYFFHDTMRWRDPIYVNFSLFREYKDDTGAIVREAYGNDNMIIYAVPDNYYNTYLSDGVLSSTLKMLPDFDLPFDDLEFGDYIANFIFTHDRLSSSGVANMKFYQPDNYTLYMRNIKFFDETKVIGEFNKPEYDDSDIDYFLKDMIINESASYNVFFSETELRIWEIYRNAFFYGAGFLLWIIAVVVLLQMGLDLRMFGGLAISLLVIIMGGISAVL